MILFGLINAPTNEEGIQIFLDNVSKKKKKFFLDKFAVVIIDDILLYSKIEEYEKHLKMLLANLMKCEF